VLDAKIMQNKVKINIHIEQQYILLKRMTCHVLDVWWSISEEG
jgi:type II secretory pathway component GspD/PulD (secretin)